MEIFSFRNIANLIFYMAILLGILSSVTLVGYDGVKKQSNAKEMYETVTYHLTIVNNHAGALKLYERRLFKLIYYLWRM